MAEALNGTALRRLRLAETYATMMQNAEKSLDEYRYYLSKTRAAVGFSLASASAVDHREMEPTTVIFIDEANPTALFQLEHGEINSTDSAEKPSKTDTDDEVESQSVQEVRSKVYRPFGLLEPLVAKQARRTIVDKVLPLLCDLANVQNELRNVEKELKSLLA